MDWRRHPWAGFFPATLCPFLEDESIDEEGLESYITSLADVDGVKGLTCNGHTGEIMSLLPTERAEVTRIVSRTLKTVNPKVKTISGVSAEGIREGVEHALAAKEAGADAILLMPPHHWLRFGRSHSTAVDYISSIAEGADIQIILHQYPAWTKAGYTLAEMIDICDIEQVVCIKMGTRDMTRWLYDYEMIKAAHPDISIITCHDEYLMPTLLEAGDGALVGFGGFAPELLVGLVHACLDGDYKAAKAAQKKVMPLARLIYNFGEPGCEAHQRMKVARWLLGKFPSPIFRRPIQPLFAEQVAKIAGTLVELGYKVKQSHLEPVL